MLTCGASQPSGFAVRARQARMRLGRLRLGRHPRGAALRQLTWAGLMGRQSFNCVA